ncbi:MAG: SDR family NAD(P)-dependent oxidoreductase [Polyangiaceae bacterium]|nr:SDR family NAD(P)-dependent oxidoreductase [Polyangiaceae bacterium]
MSLLEGKVALITGAGRGIGRAAALRLAAEGARVVINDTGAALEGIGTDPAVADAVATAVIRQGGKAVPSHDDISTAGGAAAAVQVALDAYGSLDVLVTSAGAASDRTLLKMDEASWDQVIGVNLRGTFLTLQAAARQMVAQGRGGRIVAMTGLAGYLGNFAQANLAAACGGVHGLVRTAAIELQKHKITVNAVAPLAKTRMTEALPILQGFDNVTVEHVAPVVIMLASDLCGERSGAVVAVSGARVYGFRFMESPGKFRDDAQGVFTPQEVADHWHAIIRG